MIFDIITHYLILNIIKYSGNVGSRSSSFFPLAEPRSSHVS